MATAITSAHDGDTIQLAAGEYVLNKLQNLTFNQGLTITSADPTHKAVIDGIYLQDDSGLSFKNLEVKVDPRQNVGVIVQGGDHVTLDGLNIHGAAVGNGLGVRVVEATNVTVSNAEFHHLQGGIAIARSDAVSVLNNKIHDIEIDGVQSAGSSHVTISGNTFTNFYPVLGDHSDAIQFVGTTTSAHDISITNNTYTRGVGLGNTQGIFLGNEGGVAYQNVTISGNAIVGGIYHGISIWGVDHLDLNHNIVEGYKDVNSWILIDHSTNSSETNNTATYFNPGTGNVGLVASGNVTIAQAPIGDLSILGQSPVVTTPTAPTATAPTAPTAPVVTVAAPIEIVATLVNYTLAKTVVSTTSGPVILDPNSHVWSNIQIAGAGADTLNTGRGADTLTGGAGADHFVFGYTPGGIMDVTDFVHGQDVLDVHGMLAGVGYKGTNALTDHVIVLQSDGGGGTKVMLDADGVGPAAARYVMHIEHVAPATLTAGDWIFH